MPIVDAVWLVSSAQVNVLFDYHYSWYLVIDSAVGTSARFLKIHCLFRFKKFDLECFSLSYAL